MTAGGDRSMTQRTNKLYSIRSVLGDKGTHLKETELEGRNPNNPGTGIFSVWFLFEDNSC